MVGFKIELSQEDRTRIDELILLLRQLVQAKNLVIGFEDKKKETR